ncbi:MAG TPA: adenylate/guanylate cyclase domain-containing protein [Kofleriaceae bacterium]|nr:adenylate/guanylate cyclase domain-containing protein [Kofleriaceae bacterium]
MLLGTVRRKLTALVAFSALAAVVVLPLLWWLMHRELIDVVDDRVPEAIRGFEQELGDDIKDLDVTARALGEQDDTEHAIAAKDVAALERLAGPFRDAYPDLDIIFYDADGRMVAQIGCASPQVQMPKLVGAHAMMPHGCESSDEAPVAIGVSKTAGAAGFVVVCLPLDKAYFANAQKKVGGEIALVRGGKLLVATPGFPVDHIDDAVEGGSIHDEGGQVWAIALFHAKPTADIHVGLTYAAALDVTDIKRIVRKHLLLAFAIVLIATTLSMAIGWRLATRMGSALSRVSHAMSRLEQQEYVKVDVVRTGDELEDLAQGFNAMVEGLQERDKLRTTMGKYMTEEILEHVLAGQVELGGKTIELTILFCDLRDFTTLSEKRTAQQIVEILNEYFTVMVDIIMEEGGVVDKYIGDNIMAVFGAPVSRHDDAVRAVRAAVRMREALAKLNGKFKARGLPALRFGIGLHTGEVVAGNIGSAKRMEYTVIGDAVNLASRLESKTKEIGTDILISEATHAVATGIETEAAGEVHVKGREQPVAIYKVRGLTPSA